MKEWQEKEKSKKAVWEIVDIKSPIRWDRKSCLSSSYEKVRLQDRRTHKWMSGKLGLECAAGGQAVRLTNVYLHILFRSRIIIRDRFTLRGSQVLVLTYLPEPDVAWDKTWKHAKTKTLSGNSITETDFQLNLSRCVVPEDQKEIAWTFTHATQSTQWRSVDCLL